MKKLFFASLSLAVFCTPAVAWKYSEDADPMTDVKIGSVMGMAENPAYALILKCWEKGSDPVLALGTMESAPDNPSDFILTKIRFDKNDPIEVSMSAQSMGGKLFLSVALNRDELGTQILTQFEGATKKVALQVNDKILTFDASNLAKSMVKLKPICDSPKN